MAEIIEASIPSAAEASSFDMGAPLYIGWQLTNECNLACLHCIEESGPGKAFPDELGRERAFRILEQVADAEVPFLAFSGGEPLLHPHLLEMAEYACGRGVQLKIETNAHLLTPELCSRFKSMGVKALQVSLDGASAGSYGALRAGGSYDKALAGLGMLKDAGVPVEVNYSPTKHNAGEVGRAVDLAFELGAVAFFTGRTMYTGNAVRAWRRIAPSEEQYASFFDALRRKAGEYEGRMRVCYHEMGLIEELKCRLENPAALLIVLPNGLVKLINALPFVCGDLREAGVLDVWADFKKAWRDPKVARFVADMEKRPELTSELHTWVRL